MEEEKKEEIKKEETTVQEHSVADKIHETFNDIKDSETVSEIKKYTRKHKQESFYIIASALSFLIAILVNRELGLLILGLILGLNFTKEFVSFAKNIRPFYKKAGFFRVFLVGSAILAMVLSSVQFLGLVVGIAISSATKHFLYKK